MIQSILEAPITLASNTSKVIFDEIDERSEDATPCGWLCHQKGSPLYQLLGNNGCPCRTQKYYINFNANITGATAGTPVALALFEDGVIVPGTTVIATVTAANDISNVSFGKIISVCPRSNTSISIGSVDTIPNVADPTGAGIATQAPTILNANFAILESKNNAR